MKLFLFDCDGTLVDSQHNIITAMKVAFELHHMSIPQEQDIRNIIGISLEEAVTSLLGRQEIDDLSITIAQSYRDTVIAMRGRGEISEPLYSGIADLLTKLHKVDDILLGVATGKSTRGVHHLIDEYGWENYFHTLQTSNTAPSKPHPGMIYNALSETGAEAENTVMIGDTIYDMQMGKSARAKTIAVTWGYHSRDALEQVQPDHIVSTRDELEDILMNWQSV